LDPGSKFYGRNLQLFLVSYVFPTQYNVSESSQQLNLTGPPNN